MKTARYLFVILVTAGFAVSFYQWREEAKKRLALEKRMWEYEGDLEIGKAAPSAFRYIRAPRLDSVWVRSLDPGNDTLWSYRFEDSVWTTYPPPHPAARFVEMQGG